MYLSSSLKRSANTKSTYFILTPTDKQLTGMKILNLYAGIGGNRKLWGNEHEIIAVEFNEEIAAIYKEYFPNDTVIVGDAHQYLLDHYKEFDFIWTSTPCPTHSILNTTMVGSGQAVKYPDMKLYQEIILLKKWFKGFWVSENVIPYYEPLITPSFKLQRHYFWSNFHVNPNIILSKSDIQLEKIKASNYGFDISDKKIKHNKTKIIRNLVNPEVGAYILEQAVGVIRKSNTTQSELIF